MARILYGVAGEGMGHAIRSKVILEELSKSHKIKVVTSGRSYQYLKNFFDVKEINYFKIIYRKNRATGFITFFNNFVRLPMIFIKCFKLPGIIMKFKPDLIITDFEPFVSYFGFLHSIPIISIDNIHLVTNANHHNIPKRYSFDSLIARIIIKLLIIKSNKYFINTFHDCKIENKNSVLIKPLLRKGIINAKTSNKGHILVYQTSKSNEKLLEVLKNIDEKFVVYGFYKKKIDGNIIFKNFDERGFLSDLSSCKAVITNGGFTLISEALYLKKPILSIPIKKQFEQILNALYLEELGYGMFLEEVSKEAIEKFVGTIQLFRQKLKNYQKYTNYESMREIREAIKSLTGP
ncbi:MAG: MJ1255/VC2487 family glycosyltransferase [Nanoarchaeota archaeon]